jgi:hypothetical protein
MVEPDQSLSRTAAVVGVLVTLAQDVVEKFVPTYQQNRTVLINAPTSRTGHCLIIIPYIKAKWFRRLILIWPLWIA